MDGETTFLGINEQTTASLNLPETKTSLLVPEREYTASNPILDITNRIFIEAWHGARANGKQDFYDPAFDNLLRWARTVETTLTQDGINSLPKEEKLLKIRKLTAEGRFDMNASGPEPIFKGDVLALKYLHGRYRPNHANLYMQDRAPTLVALGLLPDEDEFKHIDSDAKFSPIGPFRDRSMTPTVEMMREIAQHINRNSDYWQLPHLNKGEVTDFILPSQLCAGNAILTLRTDILNGTSRNDNSHSFPSILDLRLQLPPSAIAKVRPVQSMMRQGVYTAQ